MLISTFSSRKLLLSGCAYTGIALYALGALSGLSFAQEVPSSADVGRAERPFIEERMTPLTSAPIEVPEVVLIGAPKGAEKVFFDLVDLHVEGVSVYAESDLNTLYAHMIGTRINLADIYALSAQLTTKYRNDGYILTQVFVPPQTIDDKAGAVRLQVVEGRIGNVHVEGEESSALTLIRAYAQKLLNKEALNIRDLEHALLLINDLPGVSARSILSPSDQVGAADLRILITRRPYDALLAINNYGSRYLGPLQLSGAFALNNQVIGYNERIGAQIAISPDFGSGPDIELAYGGISYEQPIGMYGTTLHTFFSHMRTEPGFTLDQFDVKGRASHAGIQIEHPFLRTRALSVAGRATLDGRNIRNTSLVETRKDRIRALRLGAHVEVLEDWLGVATNALDLEVAKGLDIFGASNKNDPNMSRAQGNPSFLKLESEVQRLQRVSHGLNLLVAMRGQWSAHPLLSSEEFGAGGMQFGRGFSPSEIAGDHGLAGKIELQWNTPHPIDYIHSYQLFTFFDASRVWNKAPATSALARETITSTGLGVRTQITNQTSADLTIAFPLNREVATQGNKKPRVFFGLVHRF